MSFLAWPNRKCFTAQLWNITENQFQFRSEAKPFKLLEIFLETPFLIHASRDKFTACVQNIHHDHSWLLWVAQANAYEQY